MIALNLPTYSFKIKTDAAKHFIFDSIRKKYIVLTPEEWVRQNFIMYLVKEKKYPPGLIAVEMGVKINKLSQRSDLVLFNSKGKAAVVVECKAATVKITQSAFDQIARYNMKLRVKYLIVTNGLKHFCCCMNYEDNSYSFLHDIPSFSEVNL